MTPMRHNRWGTPMINKVTTTVGVVIVMAAGLVLSACQVSPGAGKYYNEGQYQERIWFDGWDKTFAPPFR